jgi:hypothetical protein
MEVARMKASRAAAKTMKTLESVEQQIAAMWETLERIEAKVDGLMFPEKGDYVESLVEEPEAKGTGK